MKDTEKILNELKEEKKKRVLIAIMAMIPSKVTRKVDTYEYESLGKMIMNDDVPLNEVRQLFTDKVYSQWFKNRYLNDIS